MTNPASKPNRTQILKKHRILQHAAQVLKKEFIGLDTIIDEIIAATSSWYFFPKLQEKPLLVNLWGLTGVGKTSLINRLAELIHLADKNYYFNFGSDDDYGFYRKMEEIGRNINSDPMILVFDEFQNARSLNSDGSDKKDANPRLIWQLLDAGKYSKVDISYNAITVDILITQLKYVTAMGVKVKNGIVVEGRDIYIKNFNHDRFCERPKSLKDWNQLTEILFVPEEIHRMLREEVPGFFFPTFDVAEKFSHMNAKQSIEFLEKIHRKITSPQIIDCSKSIIFNIGNLDEVYQMSSNFNPDINADEFHEQSLKINVPKIKNELKSRFRNEQIARLGNNHIIYPAFSSDTFRQIITMELKKITTQIFKHHKIRLIFEPSIHELIYNEGVYPTQGARPVFTTIQHLIKNNLSKLLAEIYLNAIPATRVNFAYTNNEIRLTFHKNKKLLHTLPVRQELTLAKLRKNKRDDMQAIIAVHEAGHAIISAILLNTIPEAVFSNTASQDQSGFIYTKFKWKYISRKEILSRLALYFGGLIAEKIVFGEENITASGEDDIFKATEFVNSMLKEFGMGKRMAAVNAKSPATRSYHDDFDRQIEEQAREWIDAAAELAEKTLKQQEKLLLRLADYLSDHSSISKDKLSELVQMHAVHFSPDHIIQDGTDLFYRRHLKQKINSLSKPLTSTKASFELQLNSENKSKS